MNSSKTSRKAVSGLAIAAVIAGLCAVPQVMAESMAGSAASTQTGGPQQTQSTSGATTQNSTWSGGANNGNSTTSSTTQNSSSSSTSNVSNSGDGPIGQSMSRNTTTKTTGVHVRTSAPPRRAAVVTSKKTAVVRNYRKPAKRWKTTRYDYRTGNKTVINKTVVR
ncbi:MAG: hypothetical protein SGJ27_29465 [Candidatus Melainabacteria bacterium]|nr:hypothetical protein [Candidatus Melainabacteria bacterium]